MTKTQPVPGRLRKSISPRCILMAFRAMERPRPVPSVLRRSANALNGSTVLRNAAALVLNFDPQAPVVAQCPEGHAPAGRRELERIAQQVHFRRRMGLASLNTASRQCTRSPHLSRRDCTCLRRPRPNNMARASSFSTTAHRCSRCCAHGSSSTATTAIPRYLRTCPKPMRKLASSFKSIDPRRCGL